MGSRFLKVLVGLGVIAAMLVATGSGSNKVKNGGTFVFGSAADPVVLDGALVSDGESLRADQPDVRGPRRAQARHDAGHAAARDELEGEQERARLDVQPPPGREVPRRHAVQRRGGLLQLQPLVQLPGPAPERRRVSYYWNTVFGGFAHPAPGNPGPDKPCTRAARPKASTRRSSSSRRRSSSFLGALALTNFGIASPTALHEVPGGRRHGRLRAASSTRPARSAPSTRRAPARSSSTRGRSATSSSLVRNDELLGHEGEARPAHLPADRRQRGAPAGAPDRRDPGLRPRRPGRTSRRSRATRA